MFRKSLMSLLALGIVITIGGYTVIAQTAPVTGTVDLVKADGTKERVAGALVEVYRLDIKGGAPAAKTNSKGEFAFAGLPLGTFVLSISAPGAAPTYMPGVKAGQERLLVTMSPGDGSRLPEEEVRKLAVSPATAAAPSAENTAEAKKAKAEYDAKVKEVEEKNKNIEQTNQLVVAALKAGNEAFGAKNYDVAIAKYDEGIAADPNFVGRTPVFYNNRGIALRARGIDAYNAGIKAADATEKVASLGKAKKDFADAAAGYLSSWNVFKTAGAGDATDKAAMEANKLGTLRGSIDVFQIAIRTEQVDPSVIEAAKVLIPEYQAVESDAAKKAAASLAMADLYRVAGDSENAITAYKAILETSPENHDALFGAGVSLVNLGYMNTDKAKLQEGANLLQKFASVAPDTNKFKADAVSLVEVLKKEQNVTPQKVAAPAKKKN